MSSPSSSPWSRPASIAICAVGNLHVFKGPDDFHGYGYFYVRLYRTGFGLPANIVGEFILLSVLLHVFVGRLASEKTQAPEPVPWQMVSMSVVEQAHEEHHQAAKMTETDPDDGLCPAYLSGKHWDEASGKTNFSVGAPW